MSNDVYRFFAERYREKLFLQQVYTKRRNILLKKLSWEPVILYYWQEIAYRLRVLLPN